VVFDLDQWQNDRPVKKLRSFRLIRNNKVANKIILFGQFNNGTTKNISELHVSFYKSMMQLANEVIDLTTFSKSLVMVFHLMQSINCHY
jgi:hypothetical protein